jgi:hypothetical protein
LPSSAILEKSVVIKKLFHRDMHCLGIYFVKDYEVIGAVRKIPAVKYSDTNKCWYVPDRADALYGIIECLRGKGFPLLSCLDARSASHWSTVTSL